MSVPAANLRIPRAAALLVAITMVTAAPTRVGATVVVDQPGDDLVALGLADGDRLRSWRADTDTGTVHGGPIEHWWQVELWTITDFAVGPIELEVEGREKPVRLPWRRSSLQARPELEPELFDELAAKLAEPGKLALGEAPTSPEVARLWFVTRGARALDRSGELERALDWYAAAIEVVPIPFSAELQRRRGACLMRLRRYDEAQSAFAQGAAIWQEYRPGSLGHSTLLSAQGDLFARLLEPKRANQLLEQACELRREHAPGSWLLANCLNNLGINAGRRNDLALAEQSFREALELLQGSGDSGERMLGNLAIVSRLRGDFERGEAYARQAVDLYRDRDDRIGLLNQLINLANVVSDRGEHQRAIPIYAEALELADEGGGTEEIAGVLYNRGKTHRLAGDVEAARADLLRAWDLRDSTELRTSVDASISSALGEIEADAGQIERAIELTTPAFDFWSDHNPDSTFEARAASILATLWARRGDDERAEALFQRSITTIERQQLRAGGGDRGLVAFRAKFAGLYRVFVEFLLERGRDAEAFELYERSRAQALRSLLNGRDLDFALDEPTREAAKERARLASAIESKYRQIARLASDDAEGREALRLEIERLHADREALSQRVHSASPRIAAAEAPPALDLGQILDQLPEKTLVLAFALGPEESTLFAIDRNRGLTVHGIPVAAKVLAGEIDRWIDLVTAARGSRLLERQSARLTELLLAPIADRLAEAERILVVPDGPLHRLPFGVLPDPASKDRVLLERAPVLHEVSISVFLESRSPDRATVPTRVAVFADPVSSELAVSRFRADLGRLPAARREARNVTDVFGERSALYLGERATEDAARRELGAASITHFACHAVVDEKLPLDSALVLSPSAEGGLLQAWEIAEQLELSSDLVVLSACETARGGERAGEGIVGLVRSLQVAGAESVLASLWRVHDEATSALMARFYRHLAAGETGDEALRQAQIELLRGPVEVLREGERILLDATRPRSWAPFVLVGRPD